MVLTIIVNGSRVIVLVACLKGVYVISIYKNVICSLFFRVFLCFREENKDCVIYNIIKKWLVIYYYKYIFNFLSGIYKFFSSILCCVIFGFRFWLDVGYVFSFRKGRGGLGFWFLDLKGRWVCGNYGKFIVK